MLEDRSVNLKQNQAIFFYTFDSLILQCAQMPSYISRSGDFVMATTAMTMDMHTQTKPGGGGQKNN